MAAMAAAAVAAAVLALSLMVGGWVLELPTAHAQQASDATAESPASPPANPGLYIAEFPVSGGFMALPQYAVVASQGFFMSLALGTPPQTLDLRIDTTATVPWLQCNCQQCGPSQELNQFSVFLSESIDLPKCGTEDCAVLSLSGVPFGCVNASASGTQTSYADIGATSLPPTNPYCAYTIKETIPLTTITTTTAAAASSSSISNGAEVEVYASSEGSIIFDAASVRLPSGNTIYLGIGVGCGGYQTGAWTNAREVPFGVAALAPMPVSFVHQLTSASLLDSNSGGKFLGRASLLLCLRTGDEVVQNSSRLWIGAPEFLPSVSKRSAKLMERYPASSYVINPVGVSVGAQRLPMPPAVLPRYNATLRTGGMLLNTSEAALLLPAEATALVFNAVQAQHQGLNLVVPELAGLVALEGCLCFDVRPYVKNNVSVYSRFGNITIHFGKGDGDDLVVPPQAYLYYTQADIPFACVMVRSAPKWSTQSTLGYMWMRGRLYHLNAEAGVMSWAEADCPTADINKLVDTTVVFPPPPPPSPPLVSATANSAATSNMATRHAWAHALLGLGLAAVHVAAGAWHHRL